MREVTDMYTCGKLVLHLSTLVFAAIASAAFHGSAAAAREHALSPGQVKVGATVYSTALERDTLLDIARDYDLGYNEITAANPGTDPWLPKPGAKVVVPAARLLPSAKRDGIVVNLAEMRLYYFRKTGGKDAVITYPIGVGRDGFDTPLGVYKVTGKVKDPYWFPTKASRDERPELPKAVPPGPDNPLGGYKITLSIPGYLLHGTNRPWGVGRRVSHGCIRLYPEDIERLYPLIRNGTRVEFIYQPVKAGIVEGLVMVEVHEDYKGGMDLKRAAVAVLRKLGAAGLVSPRALDAAVRERSGVPVDITDSPSPAMSDSSL